jgi:TonB family protein
VQGTVVVSVVIRENGTVGKALVFLGRNPQLDSAAVAAARQCLFSPGELSGRKVKTMMNIPFRFKLKGDTSGSSSVMGRPFTNDLHVTEWPQVIQKTEPVLPEAFNRFALPDWNLVQVLIDKNGTVRSAEVIKSAKNKPLNKASLDAARQLRFSPGKIEGEAIEMRMQIPFMYKKN